MRKFKGYIRTSMVGSAVEFEFESPDEATEKEIEEYALEAAFNWVDWGFDEVKDE